MRKFLGILEKVSDITNEGAKFLVGSIMIVMLFSTGLQVLCRYGYGNALSWPEEVNVFLMTWITFVGASIGFKKSEHIGVDMFVNKLSPFFAWTVRLIGHLVTSFIVLLIIHFGLGVAMMNTDVVSDALEIPMVIPRFSLVVGGAMMFVQLLYIVCNDLASYPGLPPQAKTNPKKEGA